METTTTPVRTLLINPIGKSEPVGGTPPTISPVNYYFFLFDLPISESIVFTDGSYDEEKNVLTYQFSYQGNDPESGTSNKTYMRSFFQQAFQGNILDLNGATVNITEVKSDGSTEVKSTGVISNPTTVELFDFPPGYEAPEPDGAEEENPSPLPQDQVRATVVLSSSISTINYYFIICMSRTLASAYINHLSLEPGPELTIIHCFYEPRPSTMAGISSDYVAAAAFLPVTTALNSTPTYSTVAAINNGPSFPLDYSSPTTL